MVSAASSASASQPAGVADDDDVGAPRRRLAQVGRRLVEERAGGCDDDHRHAPVDQRDGPVLHLAGGKALGMDVGELLQLERAFHGDGVAGAAPDVEHRPGLAQGLGERQDALVVAQHVRRVGRHVGQRIGEAGFLRRVDGAPRAGERDGEAGQRDELRGERLGRRHPDLDACVGGEHRVRLARHGALAHVDHRRGGRAGLLVRSGAPPACPRSRPTAR